MLGEFIKLLDNRQYFKLNYIIIILTCVYALLITYLIHQFHCFKLSHSLHDLIIIIIFKVDNKQYNGKFYRIRVERNLIRGRNYMHVYARVICKFSSNSATWIVRTNTCVYEHIGVQLMCKAPSKVRIRIVRACTRVYIGRKTRIQCTSNRLMHSANCIVGYKLIRGHINMLFADFIETLQSGTEQKNI